MKAIMSVDYTMFVRKMGLIGSKVIPRARITVEQIAKHGLKAVRIFTLRGRGGQSGGTPGREKIAKLWKLTHNRKTYMDIFTIHNLYPKQEVIVIFERGAEAHEIRPKRKKFMHWVDDDTGEDIFARMVHHPGVRASWMMKRTEEIIHRKADDWERETMKLADEVLRG